MNEARTIDVNKATLKEVLELCTEWKANRHYGHNTLAVVDYLAASIEEMEKRANAAIYHNSELRDEIEIYTKAIQQWKARAEVFMEDNKRLRQALDDADTDILYIVESSDAPAMADLARDKIREVLRK